MIHVPRVACALFGSLRSSVRAAPGLLGAEPGRRCSGLDGPAESKCFSFSMAGVSAGFGRTSDELRCPACFPVGDLDPSSPLPDLEHKRGI